MQTNLFFPPASFLPIGMGYEPAAIRPVRDSEDGYTAFLLGGRLQEREKSILQLG